MDEKNKKIQEQMKAEGKVKVSHFNDMVSNYFKSKYNLTGYFKFLYVEYKYFDENHQVYSLDIGQYISRPENRKVRTMFPAFIESNSIDDVRMFSVNIPGIIDINNLPSEISGRLPKGVRFISDNEIKEILFNNGYEEPFFDHYFYSMMDYPDYNLYAKPIIKIKTSIVDIDMSKKLEQAYKDGSIKQTGIIDTENFPQNIPDTETCEILNDLFSKKQLANRKVKYCIFHAGELINTTDYFDEYTYNGRKFVRFQSLTDQTDDVLLSNHDTIEKNKFYWIEVKQIDFSKNEILYADFDNSKSGRKL
jgi:hypothetical protein